MQANEGVTVEFLQNLSLVHSFVMSKMSVWLFFVLGVCILGVEGLGCPNHCFCYMWGRLARTDCVGRNLFNTFLGFSHQTQVLDLSHNVISILHGNEFLDANLRQLQDLRLSNNEIHKIDKLSFNGLQFLQNLDLSFNSIEYLNPETFKHNPNLKTLNVSFNPLSFKKDGLFLTSSSSLQVLDMTGCRLEFVTSKSFFDLKSLAILNISRNYIRTIEPGFLEGMKSLRYVDVSKNDLPCTDQTKILLQTLEKFNIQFKAFCQASQKIIMMPVLKTEENSNLKMDLYQGDYEKNATQGDFRGKSILNDVSQFFQSIPSFYAIVCGVQVGVFIGSLSTYICLKKSLKKQTHNVNQERVLGDRRLEYGNVESENLAFALIPVQTPPGTPPSPYHSRFFSNFSLSAT